MPAPTPQYTIAKPQSGVLPISGAATQNGGQTNGTAHHASSRPPAAKLKVVIRRLPPGLTQPEFENYLGDEWKVGNGKVTWAVYRPGTVVKDLAKPSRPARAYLQVSNQSFLGPLSDKVRETTFTDASNTSNDAVLLGPPSLEFATYSRTPTTKRRVDNRQGTLDQDPEYMDFLMSLTDPVQKPPAVDNQSDGTLAKLETPTETPLIAFLRRKKLEKEAAREAKSAQSKGGKHSRQSSKVENNEAKNDGKAGNQAGNGGTDSTDKKSLNVKGSKAGKETIKFAKKESAATPAAKTQVSQSARATPSAKSESTKPPRDGSNRKQETSAAARMIQRDLGLRGGRGGSRRGGTQIPDSKRDASGAETSADNTGGGEAESLKTTPAAAREATTSESTSQRNPPKGPSNPTVVAKRPPTEPAKKQTLSSGPSATQPSIALTGTMTKSAPASSVSSTATRAFLKHANPSQGVTEPLLKEALAIHGAVTFCEIDKRKGFAYVDFAEPAGLQNAIAGSPVKVAQGSVVVLERKDRPSASRATPAAGTARGGNSTVGNGPSRGVPTGPAFRGGRGSGRGRGGTMRGGSQVMAATTATATATNTESAPAVTGPAQTANEGG